MTAIATWVIRASLALALLSAIVNLTAARRLKSALFASVAALSAIYVVSYAWLLLHPTERLAWSEVMSGVSLIAWPLIWVGPAMRACWQRRRFEQALVTMAPAAAKVPA